MSLETWKEEFYPVPADQVKAKDALEHSLRKWQGLRKEALEKHQLTHTKLHHIRCRASQRQLKIDSTSCALCFFYMDANDCEDCLLRPRCDQTDDSPFCVWRISGDPEPMIAALKAAVDKKPAPDVIILKD
jgi:hypothetical protein